MTVSVWCAGCGRYFADEKAFELHATGIRTRIQIAAKRDTRRCRTEAEMRALGLKQLRGIAIWAISKSPGK